VAAPQLMLDAMSQVLRSISRRDARHFACVIIAMLDGQAVK
jgi:hypothetical protein